MVENLGAELHVYFRTENGELVVKASAGTDLRIDVLWEQYRNRPLYQQNDYIGWITRGKREENRIKRLTQMLDEQKSGNAYMGQAADGPGALSVLYYFVINSFFTGLAKV